MRPPWGRMRLPWGEMGVPWGVAISWAAMGPEGGHTPSGRHVVAMGTPCQADTMQWGRYTAAKPRGCHDTGPPWAATPRGRHEAEMTWDGHGAAMT